ncbi:hypothetical protein LCGC14_2978850 [marine sediment metagenome]|uniref:Uncharacterized protein n=1 Tax=marine sediment metagenome TaxID=412755 RepID=A0A0F8ZYB4_9ZZZZ
MNDETRSYESILADNKDLIDSNVILQLKVAKMRITIADYERAHAVAAAMAKNNDVLNSVDDRTRTYQVQGDAVEVDVEFGKHMFEQGQLHSSWYLTYADAAIDTAIEEWKQRQAK